MNNKQRQRKYEEFLHAVNTAMVCHNQERIAKLLDNAFKWSYSHRVGNGTYTDREQQQIVDQATERLTEE